MSILFTPRSALAAPAPDPQTRARANNVTESAALASSRNWIVSGLDLPTSGSRTFDISGKAWVAGYVIVLDSEAFTAPPATTSTVYLGLVRDGNGDVTAVTLATTPHASGDYVVLGAVTTDGSNVTVRDYDNRSPDTQDDPVTAAGVSYDPAASGLSSTDTQGAIDELAARSGGSSVAFAGTNIPVVPGVYLVEIHTAKVTGAAASFALASPVGTTADGYVIEAAPLSSGGTTNVRGQLSGTLLSYSYQSGATALASAAASGRMTVVNAGNVQLTGTNISANSWVRITPV